tara:strand:+ start:107 stop:484 length:378 start_codon:yes stop_codon:yes gene_type:complete
MKITFNIIFIIFLLPIVSIAVEPDEILNNEALESRARDIGKNIRCLVCQNEDIGNSNADIAKDLRVLIREKLLEGQTDSEITDYIHSRFGDFVLFKPPFKSYTIILWGLPFFLFFLLYFSFFKKK